MENSARQQLNEVTRGDTLIYNVEFQLEDLSPIPLFGQKLMFVTRLNQDSLDGLVGDIMVTHEFPNDEDSANGVGSIEIPKELTMTLIPGRNVYYEFKLIKGKTVTTVGSGNFKVLQTLAKTI